MIKVAVCDDSEISYSIIRDYLKKYEVLYDEVIILKYYSSGDELLLSYQYQYDILIMETVIKNKSCIEVAESIRKIDEKVFIIFCTEHKEFGADSYNVGAIDYLLKPFSYETLEKAMNTIYTEIFKKGNYIILKSKDKISKLPIDKILYISYYNHKLTYHMLLNCSEECYGTFKELLPNNNFSCLYQIHKSYVINMLWIERIKQKTVFLKNIQQGFLVSRYRWKRFIEEYQNFLCNMNLC